jgi:hypothetical protein
MTLRLDPRVPVVWRTPSSLQFGVDRPRLVLDDLGSLDELLISALRGGAQTERLLSLARKAGGDAAHVRALLATLDAVLLPSTTVSTRTRGHVLVDGIGPCADAMRAELERAGVATFSGPDAAKGDPALVILIAHYALPPRRYGHWLRSDVPHLPIVFGDSGVRIGPLVLPGVGPCLFCIDLEHTDRDPAWPALASQLVDRTAPGETEQTVRLAATLCAELVSAQLAGTPAAVERWSTASVHIGVDAWISCDRHAPHRDCGCRALQDAPSRPENASAPAVRADPRPSRPSSARVVALPE